MRRGMTGKMRKDVPVQTFGFAQRAGAMPRRGRGEPIGQRRAGRRVAAGAKCRRCAG